MKNECSCNICKKACERKPGWFLPGEIEKTAKLLNITVKKLFKTKLAIDWYEDFENIFVIAPAVKNAITGDMYSANPSGQCVFFIKGKCKIHKAKPFECSLYIHTEKIEFSQKRHEEVAKKWLPYQDYIKDLLGYKPFAKKWNTPFGIISFIGK